MTIMIDGTPIMARTAVRLEDVNKNGDNSYKVDTGEIIHHNYDDGAVVLAKKLLDTIEEL